MSGEIKPCRACNGSGLLMGISHTGGKSYCHCKKGFEQLREYHLKRVSVCKAMEDHHKREAGRILALLAGCPF